jgi:hypothetical protein
MPETNMSPVPKHHMKAFWPLVIIFVIAAIAAGLIFWFQFSFSMESDLDSMVITVHRRTESQVVPVKKTTTVPKTTTTK